MFRNTQCLSAPSHARVKTFKTGPVFLAHPIHIRRCKRILSAFSLNVLPLCKALCNGTCRMYCGIQHNRSLWHGFCGKFIREYNSESILKIGRYLSKLCALILFKTSAPYKSFTYLLIYLLTNVRWHSFYSLCMYVFHEKL